MLWQSPASQHLSCLLHVPAGVVAWPNLALLQTQLARRLMVVLTLPGPVHPQSKHSHSQVGPVAYQGAPLQATQQTHSWFGVLCVPVGIAAPIWYGPSCLDICQWVLQPGSAQPAPSSDTNVSW